MSGGYARESGAPCSTRRAAYPSTFAPSFSPVDVGAQPRATRAASSSSALGL